MSGSPTKMVTGAGAVATGTVLAQTGLGLRLFVAIAAAVVCTAGGALLLRAARLSRTKARG